MEYRSIQILWAILTLVVVINLLALNAYVLLFLPKQLQLRQEISVQQTTQPTAINQTADSCGPTCQATIAQSVENLASSLATVAGKPSTITTIKTANAAVKEIFIPLGSGSTQSDTWEDIPGTDAYIDTAKYAGVTTTYFEASLKIPTKNGQVFARLYNVTDKHPVWFSDLSTTSDTSTFSGAKIALDPGNKLYRVQMKTTLKYESVIDSARVKILLR